MCGIIGTVGFANSEERESSESLARHMCGLIAHRGPDDEGYYIDTTSPGAMIGMRRLSIIDVTHGKQPITNEDGSVWIVFNGEIYNYRELRENLISKGHKFRTRTDTETIIHLYEEEGADCVKKLRGMFAFAIWDKRDNSLLLARDRAGKKPLHYSIIGESIVFGSEIKSLLVHPRMQVQADPGGISDFITFGYVPDPITAFKGINKLPPGHTLTFKSGRVQIERYWDFEYLPEYEADGQRSEADYIEELRDLLAESVRVRLESEVPLGAFLSGGIDSSTVVAYMAREMGRPVKTFSIGFNDASFDELKFARLTAEKFKTDHHEFIVSPDVEKLIDDIVYHHDEPFADVSSIPTFLVSKMAREHVTVVLTGDGGDEVFAGYERYIVEAQRRVYSRIPRIFRKNVMSPVSRALPRNAYGKNFIRNISLDDAARYVDYNSYFNEEKKRYLFSSDMLGSIGDYNSSSRIEEYFYAPASTNHLNRLMYFDSKVYLPGDVLAKVDRMSMANSLETRAPLLDHKLIEFAQRIPPSLKLKGLETKYILKKAVEGIIPQEIIYRKKQGFDVPIKHWFNIELKDMIDDTLNDSKTRTRGIFNHKEVVEILDEHRRGRRDNARQIWELFMLELWFRRFIDNGELKMNNDSRNLSAIA